MGIPKKTIILTTTHVMFLLQRLVDSNWAFCERQKRSRQLRLLELVETRGFPKIRHTLSRVPMMIIVYWGLY